MPMAFRVTARNGDLVGDANTLDEVLELVKGERPGRYRIDKLYPDPVAGELRCWAWGEIIKGKKGQVRLELPPWID